MKAKITRGVNNININIFENGFTLTYSGWDNENGYLTRNKCEFSVDELVDDIRDIIKVSDYTQ